MSFKENKDQGLTFPTLRQTTLSTPIAIPRRQPRISLFCSPPKWAESPEGLVFDMSPVETTFSDNTYPSIYGFETTTPTPTTTSSGPGLDRTQSSPTVPTTTREPFLYTFPTPSPLLGFANKNRVTSFSDTCSTSSSVDEVVTPTSASHYNSREPSVVAGNGDTPRQEFRPRRTRGFKPVTDYHPGHYGVYPSAEQSPKFFEHEAEYRFQYRSTEKSFTTASRESEEPARMGRFERY